MLIDILRGPSAEDQHLRILASVIPGDLRACMEFHRRVKTAVEFGLRDPARAVTLAEVAGHVAMEKTAFCRYFKLKVGRSYVSVISALRVRYAAELLARSDYSIGEVTALVGFENRTTFARRFRSHFGVTPSAFRSQNVPVPAER
jgi:transcriptional regulator GlxA family with amidase domain